MKITILGTGTSHGIPVIGCGCPVCTSGDPRDNRTRTSVYIEGALGESALIDAGPEFRLQAVKAGVKRLDGIFLTHAHADHIHGLDDVRPFSWDKALPVYGNESTITEVKERFSYIWKKTQIGGGKPRLNLKVVNTPALSEPVKMGDLNFAPIPVKHGVLDILGWEVTENRKSFLYLTDVSEIPEAEQARLGAADWEERVIVIGALRKRPHETHFTFEQAINAALGLGANSIYLTHICHEHAHSEIDEFCQNFKKTKWGSMAHIENIEIHPAYDGMEITL